MNEKELTMKLLDIFPNITVHVTKKNNNLRAHFKAEEHNFVPSKWLLHNTLDIPLDQIKVQIKRFDAGGWTGPGKLFILINGVYLE